MIKKMMLLAMAVGAIVAFAAPAMAQAAELSDPEPVEPGAWLLATSTNTVTTVGGGASLVCAHVELSGEAEGTAPEVTSVTGGGTTANCEITPSGAPAEVNVLGFTLDVDTEEAEFAFEFSSEAAGLHNCTASTTGGLFPVTAEWTLNTDVVHLFGGPLVGGGPEGCPKGAEEIHGTFTVTTTDGTPVERTS